jgi:hydroxyethylthiazole kinase-like uncharacterized protein yjeF
MLPPFAPVYLRHEVRAIESGASGVPLMERAGAAIAGLAPEMLSATGKRVLLVAGPGNNGGDAFVAARLLRQAWFDVRVLFTGNASKLPADASEAFTRWRDAGGGVLEDTTTIPPADLLVDGLFGIGLTRPLDDRHAALVERMNAGGCPILSIDIPSGLDADTGSVARIAVHAARTLTFLGLKPGLLTLDGPDHCGELGVDMLGVEPPPRTGPGGWLVDPGILRDVPAPRARNSHKGSFGTVGIIGGAPGMAGAALLAGRAALRLGAGKVRLGMLDESLTVDPLQPELMLRPAQELLRMPGLSCIACGPGLGQSQSAGHALAAVLEHAAPLVLDADALNLLAQDAGLQEKLRHRGGAVLLTPHPAEAARLLGVSTGEVQADRVASATGIARRLRAHVVLKGNGSVCAAPDGDWYVNVSGNAGMASAGMGDVLTGLLAALLAQGAEPLAALLGGVYLHGAAADLLVDRGIGPVGLTASEVIDAARQKLNAVRR